MRIKHLNNYYILRIEKDEEIVTTLREAVTNKKIKSAFFFGLGVGKNLVLGYFDVHRKIYVKKVFEDEYEFTSFSGNITKSEGETIIHCHVTITDSSFNAFGGHLFHGIVPATLEIVIFPFTTTLKRKKDKNTKLNLLDV